MQLSPKRYTWTMSRREAAWAYVFISPWILGFFIFTIGPMIASFYYSFTEYNIITPPDWIGLANFHRLWSDPLFWQSIRVTLYYAALALPLKLVLGFLLFASVLAYLAYRNIWADKKAH